MGDRESANLIFAPGLSTAEHISNVSGRGAAMDFVKTSIEKIAGAEDVSSVPGSGTTVRMKIPLRIPIIPALIVTSGDNRWAKSRTSVYASSIASDTPWPTPTHIVASARFAPVLCN
jgi:two-component system, chemotaxis family, sensor kinase CheA